MLQSPDKNCRTVSYREDLKDEFAKATQIKSPVKMTAVKRKQSHFHKTKTDTEVTNNTVLEILEENDFEFAYIKYDQIGKCPLVDVAPILSYKKARVGVVSPTFNSRREICGCYIIKIFFTNI